MNKSNLHPESVTSVALTASGITLIALVVTIIVLIILAGISISLISGGNGILNKATSSRNESDKQTATELIQMKITAKQMDSYAEFQRLPTLQELADFLCENEDNDIEYVKLGKEIGALDFINVAGYSSIFTKLKEYPYEFEIDQGLRLASVDGVQIANNDSDTVSKSEYDQLASLVQTLNQEVTNLKNNTSSSGEANPTGTVIAYYASTAPIGYLACDGTEYNLTEHPEYRDLATLLGVDSSATKFNVPDLRGEFLRGTGTNSHSNQGNGTTVGTHQDATIHWNMWASSDDGGSAGYSIPTGLTAKGGWYSSRSVRYF